MGQPSALCGCFTEKLGQHLDGFGLDPTIDVLPVTLHMHQARPPKLLHVMRYCRRRDIEVSPDIPYARLYVRLAGFLPAATFSQGQENPQTVWVSQSPEGVCKVINFRILII